MFQVSKVVIVQNYQRNFISQCYSSYLTVSQVKINPLIVVKLLKFNQLMLEIKIFSTFQIIMSCVKSSISYYKICCSFEGQIHNTLVCCFTAMLTTRKVVIITCACHPYPGNNLKTSV
jgi:hypothetical protein